MTKDNIIYKCNFKRCMNCNQIYDIHTSPDSDFKICSIECHNAVIKDVEESLLTPVSFNHFFPNPKD